MGMVKEIVGGTVTQTGIGNFVAAVPAAGDSFTVRAFASPATAYLETLCLQGATTSRARVRSPSLHDDTQGTRVAIPAADPANRLGQDYQQVLRSGDALAVEAAGTAAEVDVIALGIYYTDAGGMAARLVNPGDIGGRIAYVLGYEVACTGGAAAGAWGDTLINATEDVWHANADYAVLGYGVSVPCTAVAIRGGDTGNVRCGGSGTTVIATTRRHFVELSQITGRPQIPVIAQGNKGSTYISVLANSAALAVNVTLFLAQLS